MDELEKKNFEVIFKNKNRGVLVSSKPAAQIQSELESSIGNWLFALIPNRPKFVGSVSDRRCFVFRNGWIRNDFRRHLEVEVTSTESGSEIHYCFKTSKLVKIFMSLWFFFLFIALVVFSFQYFLNPAHDTELLNGSILVFFMIFFGALLFKYGYLITIWEEDQVLDFIKEIASSE